MSFISAGNTTTTTLLINGDTTGNLVFNTGGANTTALTISNTQNATFANNVTITGTTTQTGNASFANATFSGSVGIGTTSPSTVFQISNGATPRISVIDTRSSVQTQVLSDNIAGYTGTTSNHPYIFVSNNSERMRLDANGNLGLGTTGASTVKLFVVGTTSNNAAFTHYVTDSSGAILFYIRNDGLVNTGLAASSPYNATTGTAANLVVDSNGSLTRSVSSLKYKHDVKDAYYGLENLLQLRPVTYKGNNDGDKTFGGLIAEEVDAAGLKEFVVYREDDGTPDGLAYGNMVSLCIKAIQELNAKVDAQAAEIAALKAGA